MEFHDDATSPQHILHQRRLTYIAGMSQGDDLESQANILSFSSMMESLSTIAASCEHGLLIRSLSPEQVEQLALQAAHTLATIHSHQNALLPVSKLPPELLSRVFQFAVSPTTVDIYHRKSCYTQPVGSAVSVARVCSSWRAVALASSQLWYHIIDNDIGWPSRPTMFLERSRNSHIHLYTTLPDALHCKGHAVWPTIIHSHANRVQELHLLIDRVYPIQDLLDLISSPLPSLELLTITTDSDGFFVHSARPPQPPMILGAAALNLKALALGADAPFIPGNSFPNLVNLQLSGMGRSVGVTTTDLLDLLSNCPRVETFELDSPIPDLEVPLAAKTSNRPPLALRHLKALWMNELHAVSAFTFLAMLELPAVSTVRLTDLHAGRWFPTPPGVLPLAHMGLTQLDILESGRHAGPETPFELRFLAHGPGARTGLWIHLLFWRPAHGPGGGRPPALSEQYACEERVFWGVLGALPTRDVTELRLSTLRAAHLARAEQIVQGGRMPALESLVVRSLKVGSATEQWGMLHGLAHALAPGDIDVDSEQRAPGSWPGQPGDGDVPVPRLGELTIELNRTWKPEMGHHLVRMLQERKRRGHPLRSVACSAPSVGDSGLEERIREHVLGEVNVTDRKLWKVRKVPEVWMVKNDYWRLYPESLVRGVNGWGLPGNT